MRGTYLSGTRFLGRAFALATLIAACCVPAIAFAQQRDDYLLGEERRLEMIVHVLGEVTRPGEYRVPDDTDVLELISKAGGGTQLAKLSAVTITRMSTEPEPSRLATNGGTNGHGDNGQGVIHVNLDAVLEGKASGSVPVLRPGDVVSVPRNSLSTWRTAASILRDLSVVFTAYLLAVRTFEN